MNCCFLVDVVVLKCASVFQLLSGVNESLLVRWNSFLVLNFVLYVLNCVSYFNIKSDGFASESLDKDLHTTSEP